MTIYDIETFKKFSAPDRNYYWEYVNGSPVMIKEKLTDELIIQHLNGVKTLGFSPFVDNENLMFFGYDFDAHRSDEETDEEFEKKVQEAQSDSEKMFNFYWDLGFPVILNSSGSKGRHLRVYCEGANAKYVRLMAKWIMLKILGNPDKHEIFPKQDDLNESRPYGNQMKGLFAIHPKHKKRANVILNGRELDILSGLNYCKGMLNNEFILLGIDEEELEEYNKLNGKIKYSSDDFDNKNLQDIPEYCEFFEKFATEYPLQSGGEYTRHLRLDPQMAAYRINHEETCIKYMVKQQRNNMTCFNWKNKWVDNIPTFNCGAIINYLRYWQDEAIKNQDIEKMKLYSNALISCESCKYFKKYKKELNNG